MKGWLLYSKLDGSRNEWYIQSLIQEGRNLGIDLQLLWVDEICFGIRNDKHYLHYHNKPVEFPDFAICRMRYPLLSKQLELLGIPVFNSSKVSRICNDKAETYQYIAGRGIPVIDTEFIKHEFLEDKLRLSENPFVIKSASGHGGTEVFLAKEELGLTEIKKVLRQKDSVCQPFIGGRKEDLRVYVMGNKIIASVLRRAKEGFRSNFCLGGEAFLYSLTEIQKINIEKIIALFSFDFVGIDFIIADDGSLLFNEIEDVVGSRMLYQYTDLNAAALYLSYIKNKRNDN